MKIAVFADLHNSVSAMDTVARIVAAEKPNKVVFCGDLFGGYGDSKIVAEKAENLDCTLYFIRGNNDWVGERFLRGGMDDYAVMYHFGRTLFFTHGDRYNKYNIPVLLKENDVLVYGHTHAALLQKYNGLFVANVGSVAKPRDGHHSYAILDENGIVFKDMNGAKISEIFFDGN